MSTESVSADAMCFGGEPESGLARLVRATLFATGALRTAARLENLILVIASLMPPTRFSNNREEREGGEAGD